MPARKKAKYQTNFEKRSFGNSIPEGSELVVKVHGAEVVTAQVRHPKNGPVIIGQSHKADKDRKLDTVHLLLKRKRWMGMKKDTLPVGKYVLRVWYWDNDTMTGGGFEDEFEIV